MTWTYQMRKQMSTEENKVERNNAFKNERFLKELRRHEFLTEVGSDG